MALFFCLSGFLITRQILSGATFVEFLSKRLLRVLPVAWLCILIVSFFVALTPYELIRNYLFVANLPPQVLVKPIDHFWSLDLEVQFYLGASLVILFRPALIKLVLPLFLLVVIAIRVSDSTTASSVTWYRIDDLLAGGCLAIVCGKTGGLRILEFLKRRVIFWMLLFLLCVSCLYLPDRAENYVAYFRSVICAAWVGSVVVSKSFSVSRFFNNKFLLYVASISYALYVWHLPLADGWLGSGALMEKYAKRPLLFIVLFAIAHISTFYFERFFTEWGRRRFNHSRTKGRESNGGAGL